MRATADNAPARAVGNIWVRQRSDVGQAIINAQTSSNQGRTLTGVRIFVFDTKGEFVERIEAKSADLEAGAWRLSDASFSRRSRARKCCKNIGADHAHRRPGPRQFRECSSAFVLGAAGRDRTC